MKKVLFLLLISLLLPLLPTARAAAAEDRLVILSTTDLHGKCWETQLLTGKPEQNNLLRIASAVRAEREANGADRVLLFDNGDLYQGDLTSSYPLSLRENGESDLPPAMAVALAQIGYTAAGIGNHEFNYSWALMDETRAWLADRGVPSICANLYYDGSDGVHTAGTPVLTPVLTKTVALSDRTVRVGVIGLTNTDCARWDEPDRYPGMVFAHPDNTDCSIAWEVEHWLPALGTCDLVIVLYHGGLGTSSAGPLVYGENTENQALRLIRETVGIDLVVCGHDHFSKYSNCTYENRDGLPVTVVNGGGVSLTRTVFVPNPDPDGRPFLVKSSENLAPADYPADPELESLIAPYAALAAKYLQKQFFQLAAEPRVDWSGAYLLGNEGGVILDPVSMAPKDGTACLDRLRGAPRITAEGTLFSCQTQLVRSDLDAYLLTVPSLGADACLCDQNGSLAVTTDQSADRLWRVEPWEDGYVLRCASTGRYLAYHAISRVFDLRAQGPLSFRLWEGNDPCIAFGDVNPHAWYHAAVDLMLNCGLMGSIRTDSYCFSPYTRMTRSMLARVLYELAGSPAQTGSLAFEDASDGQWYSSAVLWASETGIMAGYGNGRFGVADPVTREQLASILWRFDAGAHAAPDVDLSVFIDAEDLSAWATDGAAWAVGLGLIQGRAANAVIYLAAQGEAGRAEFASMFSRYLLILEAQPD